MKKSIVFISLIALMLSLASLIVQVKTAINDGVLPDIGEQTDVTDSMDDTDTSTDNVDSADTFTINGYYELSSAGNGDYSWQSQEVTGWYGEQSFYRISYDTNDDYIVFFDAGGGTVAYISMGSIDTMLADPPVVNFINQKVSSGFYDWFKSCFTACGQVEEV